MLGAVAVALLAPAAAPAATTVYNENCNNGCATCSVAQEWEDGKCYPVGNAPPYHSSQKATITNETVVLTSYMGDNCSGTATQKDPHALDKCVYFTGTIWTLFTTKKKVEQQPLPAVGPKTGGHVVVAECGTDSGCDGGFGKSCVQKTYKAGECFMLPGNQAPRKFLKCDSFFVDVQIWNLGDKDCSGTPFPNPHQDPLGQCSGVAPTWEYIDCKDQ